MSRFITPEPLPTAHEAELLENLIEECAEVIQRATKMLRFGVKEIQPDQPLTNAERLAVEAGQLLHMIDVCLDAGLMTRESLAAGRAEKARKLPIYMQTQADGNT